MIAPLEHGRQRLLSFIVIDGGEWMARAGCNAFMESLPKGVGAKERCQQECGAELGARSDGAKLMSVDSSLEVPVKLAEQLGVVLGVLGFPAEFEQRRVHWRRWGGEDGRKNVLEKDGGGLGSLAAGGSFWIGG